jgi:integrase
MTFNISIYADTRYDTDHVRFFMQLTWTKSKGVYGKITRELPKAYAVSKDGYNPKKKVIDGKSTEATTVRDRHFALKDMIHQQKDRSFEENLKEIADYLPQLDFTEWIGSTVQDTTKPVTLRDYIRRYLDLKGDTISYDYKNKYLALIRNLSMFIKKYPVGDDNLNEKDEDQQKIFFSKYVTFLNHDVVDDKELGQKKEYENASVREEFRHMAAVCNEFRKVGLQVKLDSFTANLRTPGDSSEQPHVTYDEIQVILKNLDKLSSSIEEKSVYVSVFQYFTGLRHNELYQVEDRNITIKMMDDVQFKVLNYISDKTGKQNSVPLNNVCLEIIEHWRGKKFKAPKRRGKVFADCLLPVLTLTGMYTGFRSFLKKLPDFCVEVSRIRYRGSERIDQRMPRWKRLGTHAFRHGYSAFLSSRDMSIDDVGQLLNHGAGSKTARKHYEHIDRDKIMLQAYKALEKVG